MGLQGRHSSAQQASALLLLLRRCPGILLTLIVLHPVENFSTHLGNAPACRHRSAAAPLLHGKQPAAHLGSSINAWSHRHNAERSRTSGRVPRETSFSSFWASGPSATSPISSRSSRRYREVNLSMFVRNVGAASNRVVPLAAFDIHAHFHWFKSSCRREPVRGSMLLPHHRMRTYSWKYRKSLRVRSSITFSHTQGSKDPHPLAFFAWLPFQ